MLALRQHVIFVIRKKPWHAPKISLNAVEFYWVIVHVVDETSFFSHFTLHRIEWRLVWVDLPTWRHPRLLFDVVHQEDGAFVFDVR